MRASIEYAAVERLIDDGRFLEAHSELVTYQTQAGGRPSTNYHILLAELALELGFVPDARRSAETLAGLLTEDNSVRARAHRVLARCCFHAGDLESSRQHLTTARHLCQASKNDIELAKVELTRFSLFLGVDRLESDVLMLPSLRRLIAKVAQPHLLVELRLCVARYEARRHSPYEAKKHLRIVARLLESYPNLWLQGVLALDSSNVESLLGDIDASLLHAMEAMRVAKLSGHNRTRSAAAVNISHLLCSQNKFSEAKEYLNRVLEGSANLHLRLAALDSWANQLINLGEYDRCRTVFDQARNLAENSSGHRLHWDSLTELFSTARLAQAEDRWADASSVLSSGANLADQCGDRLWARRMRLVRCRCLARLGQIKEAAVDFCNALTDEPMQPQELAEYYCALAAMGVGDSAQTLAFSNRATGIAQAISDSTLRKDMTVGLPDTKNDSGNVSPPNLDSAVALIELGGHPHILAREALAVLDAAGCARAVALVVAGPERTARHRGARLDRARALGRGRQARRLRSHPARPTPRRALAARRRSEARSSTTAAPSSPSAS